MSVRDLRLEERAVDALGLGVEHAVQADGGRGHDRFSCRFAWSGLTHQSQLGGAAATTINLAIGTE